MHRSLLGLGENVFSVRAPRWLAVKAGKPLQWPWWGHGEENINVDGDNIADCRLDSGKLTAVSHGDAPCAVDLLRRPSSSMSVEPLPPKIAWADLSAVDVSHRSSRRKPLLLTHNYCEGSCVCRSMCSVGRSDGQASTCTSVRSWSVFRLVAVHSCCQEITKMNHVLLEISCVFVLLFMLLRITLACPRVLLPLQLRSNLINVKSSRVTFASYEIIAGPIKSVHFECLRTRHVERKKATADVLQKWDSEVFPAHPVDRDSPCFRTTGCPRLLPWFHIYILKISQTGSGRPPVNTTLSLCERLLSFTRMMWVDLMPEWLLSLCLSSSEALIKVDCCATRTSFKARLPFLCSSSSKLLFCLSLLKTPNANICFSSLLTCADADIFLWCISEGPLYIALALS